MLRSAFLRVKNCAKLLAPEACDWLVVEVVSPVGECFNCDEALGGLELLF